MFSTWVINEKSGWNLQLSSLVTGVLEAKSLLWSVTDKLPSFPRFLLLHESVRGRKEVDSDKHGPGPHTQVCTHITTGTLVRGVDNLPISPGGQRTVQVWANIIIGQVDGDIIRHMPIFVTGSSRWNDWTDIYFENVRSLGHNETR